jgi:acetoacetate decarboxylase
MDRDDREVTPLKLTKFFGGMFTGSAGLWENSRFIIAEVPLDPKELKRVLPFGLWPTHPATGILFIVNYLQPSFTIPYKEAALLVKVRTLLGNGLHCCWMVVDDDTAMIYGRELLGYPKKMATITFEESGNSIKASVTRRGIRVLSMTGEKGEAQNPAAPVFDQKTFNVGGLGQFMAFSPVWLFRPRELIKESYAARVTMKIAPSDYDPISRIVAGDPLSGRFVVSDIPGTHYNLPVWVSGLRHFANTFFMRYR